MQYLQTIEFKEFDKMIADAQKENQNIQERLLLDDDDKAKAKNDRADTNKMIASFKEQAKKVKDEKIGLFNSKVKQVIDALEANQLLFKEKVEQYDEKWKNKRQEFIRTIINFNISEDVAEFVKPMMLYDKRYLNATVTETKIKEDVANKVSKIKADFKIAQTISAQVAELFKTTLDVTQAIEIDKQQQEEQARREAIAKAEAERQERERQEILARQKERERQAMVEAELAEAKENGEVVNAEKISEINQKANEYANKEAVKVAAFTVSFEYKDSDYPMAWQNPLADLEERLQGLEKVEVLQK